MTTTFDIGDKIDTGEQFTALPIGTVLTDEDDWVHTKVADPYPGRHTTVYVDNNGETGTFHSPWDYNLTITSFPTNVQEDDMITNPFTTGQTVTFVNHPVAGAPSRPFKAGDKVTVVDVIGNNLVEIAEENDLGGSRVYSVEWFEGGGAVPAPEETPARPTIDFSTDSRKTAREYAEDLISRRVNKDDTNQVLTKVRDGAEEVDAYDLNIAVLDAMRGVATRFGQSPARREAGRKAAHLGHIAHAVLSNHVDNLPAYEKGERSQKLRDLEAELASTKGIAAEQAAKIDEQARLLDEAQPLLQDARLNLDRLREERDAVTSAYDAALEREKSAERANEAAQATLAYAIASLSEEDKQRVLGYWDAQRDVRS